uniref:Kinesin-like protein n=1 Tax=Rhizophora mucronata TaxID=61149 RepID=A0A2P2ITY6_RHIMU
MRRKLQGMMCQTGNASMTTLSYTETICQFQSGPCTQLLIHLTRYLGQIAPQDRCTRKEQKKLLLLESVVLTQAYLHMDKQVVERRIPWMELLSTQWQTYMNT